ncbi:hypothetical protein [Terricaulis sp.]|uniref:hypothetical protein n=1 Tax=Terricaulis sp. TaxID=2768686 RepID=UPI003783ABD0
MRKMITAALMLGAASFATYAVAQSDMKPGEKPAVTVQDAQLAAPMPGPESAPDAQSLASTQQVGEARRYYRAQCERYEAAGFCDCVTAGMAQALMPEELRIAGRTIGERINAQGDSYSSEGTDLAPAGASSAMRIEQAEAHYADTCQQFRR